MPAHGVTSSVRGRPPSTTREEVSRTAFDLFASKGFEATTMSDVASALGVGRRTLFRYFDSKNDLVWGDFDWVLDRLRDAFAATSAELRIRMTLITTVPALQAHSMLRYAEWRQAVAEFAAERLGIALTSLAAQAIGHAALAASMSAFSHWVEHPDEDLIALLRQSYALIASGFDSAALPDRSPTRRR